jgi:hypothetical protein
MQPDRGQAERPVAVGEEKKKGTSARAAERRGRAVIYCERQICYYREP